MNKFKFMNERERLWITYTCAQLYASILFKVAQINQRGKVNETRCTRAGSSLIKTWAELQQ